MAHAFFLGVDARPDDEGSLSDVTYALFEKSQESSNDPVTYRLHRTRRHTDVSAIDDLADRLQGLLAEQPYIGRTSLIVNRRTEAGQALVDALSDRGLDPVPATLTEGTGGATGDAGEMGVHLAGIEAVRTLANRHREGALVLDTHTTETASRLARDVQALAEQLDEADGDLETLGPSTAGPSFDPAATHVTSAALAVWLGTERSFDPSQRLKESPQTESASPDGL